MHLCILTALHHLPKDWILSAKHSSSVYWHIKIKPRVLPSYIDILPLVFLCLHQGPLRWNGHCFSYVSHQGPLRWNGHLFPSSHQGPLWWNGHWFLCHNRILSFRMVESVFFFGSRPFSLIRSLYMLDLFFLFSFETQTKLVFLSLLIFYFDNLWKLIFHTIK